MLFLRASTLTEALQMKAAHPGATPISGGTDVMVEINFDRHRPATVIDLTPVAELAEWTEAEGRLRVGAGVTYARLIRELGGRLPGLAMAARTVGSPQIRNRGTVGGNLGSASPAGDAHPPLTASRAEVEVASLAGVRRIPVGEFFLGPKRNALRPDELISAFLVDPAPGPQQFSKVGTRNAMVIAVCSFALELDPRHGRAGTGIGSAGPTPLAAVEAEGFLANAIDEAGGWGSDRPLPDSVVGRFAELVAAAASPIDDVRGTASYRRHALRVLAARSLRWAWADPARRAAA